MFTRFPLPYNVGEVQYPGNEEEELGSEARDLYLDPGQLTRSFNTLLKRI